MPDPNDNTVFIVDDHDIVRFGLESLVRGCSQLRLAGSAASLTEALRAIASLRPALVMSDMSMDDSKGLDTVKAIVSAQLPRPTLVISMHDEMMYGEQVLALGARGYLMKERAHAFAVPAALSVLGGDTWVSTKLGAKLLNNLSKGRRGPQPGAPVGENGTLSMRELQVLEFIATGKTTKEIAFALDISPRTVDIHRSNLKKKLGLRSGSELIAFALSRI